MLRAQPLAPHLPSNTRSIAFRRNPERNRAYADARRRPCELNYIRRHAVRAAMPSPTTAQNAHTKANFQV